MDLNDIITLVVNILNSVFVAMLSLQEIKREKASKVTNKKKAWYQTEVISDKKLQEHLSKVSEILYKETSKVEMCQRMNEAMLDFFYTSINYVAFFDTRQCEALKKKLMAAVDAAMCDVLSSEGELTYKEKGKILNVYRINVMYLFYEFDMKIENEAGSRSKIK